MINRKKLNFTQLKNRGLTIKSNLEIIKFIKAKMIVNQILKNFLKMPQKYQSHLILHKKHKFHHSHIIS